MVSIVAPGSDYFAFFGTLVFEIFTVCFYSFYWKYNPFFRFAEATYVAGSMGVGLALGTNVIITQGFNPLVAGQDYWLFVPMVLGILFMTRISNTHFWISRYASAVLVGVGIGVLTAGQIGGSLIPQIAAEFVSFNTPVFTTNINNFIIVAWFVLVCYYFFWTAKSRTGFAQPVKSAFLRVCRIAVMATYGTYLGYTGIQAYSNLVYGRIWELLQFIGIAPQTPAQLVLQLIIGH